MQAGEDELKEPAFVFLEEGWGEVKEDGEEKVKGMFFRGTGGEECGEDAEQWLNVGRKGIGAFPKVSLKEEDQTRNVCLAFP